MANSIKLTDDKYIDTQGIWDSTRGVSLTSLMPRKVGTQHSCADYIEVCKELCAIMEGTTPYMFIADNGGTTIYIGYTYDKSSNPSWATFIAFNVFNSSVVKITCMDYSWTTRSI